MTSQDMQILLKNNSEELQDYLRDLKNWEEDIKIEDFKLTENKNCNLNDIPPIRKKNAKSVSMKNNSQQMEKKKESRISSYDYEAWDKFVALESENEDETSEREPKNNADTKINIQDNKENLNNSESITRRQRAETLKEEGNLYYAQGKLSDAIAKYTQGIGLNPLNALLPANRAMAYIKLKKYEAAENDCTKALKLDPNYIKAYLRRASTRVHLSNISGAIEDYEKVLKFEPWNKDAKRELEKLNDGKGSSNEEGGDVPPLEDAAPLFEKQDTQIKRMKIEEEDSNKSPVESSATAQVHPISKPLHLQSMKPLIRVPVVEINSRNELDDLLNEMKGKKPSKSNVPKQSIRTEMIEIEQLSLPKPPRTSHQFAQDWQKINKSDGLRHSYLQSIPVTFFDGIEIEADLLLEIVDALCADEFEAESAASIMAALMTTRGFFLNVAFLNAQQRISLEKLILKMENCESTKEKIQTLRQCLYEM